MAIAKWQDFFNPHPQNLEKRNYLVFEEDYQKEIEEWLKSKQIPTAEKDRFIDSLINFDDDCGGFYDFRAYFLAAKYIAIFPGSSFADEIAEQLLDWSHGNFWCSKSKIDFHKTIAKEADKALKITDHRKAIAAHEKTIQSTKQKDLLISTAKKLLELDPQNEIAIAAIKNVLCEANKKENIFNLIKFCVDRKILLNTISEILLCFVQQINNGDDPDYNFWIDNSLYYLKITAIGDTTIIKSLICILKRFSRSICIEDEYLYELIIATLAVIGKDNHDLITILSNFLLENNLSDNLHFLTAKALWQIDKGNQLTIDSSVQLLRDSIDIYIKEQVSLFILEASLSSTTVTKEDANLAISNIFKSVSSSLRVNYEMANILGKAGLRNNNAKEALLKLLDTSEDNWSRVLIANNLLKLYPNNRKALNAIYEVIATEQKDFRRYHTAKSLLDINPDNEVALSALNELLKIATDKYTRLRVAKRLALSDPSNRLAIDTLYELIYLSGSLSICIDEQDLPLSVLEKIDPSKKLAIKALEDFAEKTKDQDALIYIIKHLKRLDPSNDVAQRRLDRIIATVINSMQTYDPNDDSSLLNILIYGRGIRSSQLLPETVISLKPYLNHQGSTNREIACLMIWKCAKQMSYQDFYQAWHIQTDNN